MILYGSFLALILVLLALDLGVFHKDDHVIDAKEALKWSAFWIGLGVAFSGVVYIIYEHGLLGIASTLDLAQCGNTLTSDCLVSSRISGTQATFEYLSGYLIEKSLSVDNIFVIVIIFQRFKIPPMLQHRVLFWGIVGALVFRGGMIAAGIQALRQFDWMFYVFGGLLIFLALKMLISHDDDDDPTDSMMVRAITKVIPFSKNIDGHKFVLKENGKKVFSRLALALLVIEITDLIFAVDSIPAVFAVTQESFIVFSSNIFAILGLRSLYFALADLVHRFAYLKYSLVGILLFVGVKMILINQGIHLPTLVSLGVICGLLVMGILFSLKMTQGAASLSDEASPMTDESLLNLGVRDGSEHD